MIAVIQSSFAIKIHKTQDNAVYKFSFFQKGIPYSNYIIGRTWITTKGCLTARSLNRSGVIPTFLISARAVPDVLFSQIRNCWHGHGASWNWDRVAYTLLVYLCILFLCNQPQRQSPLAVLQGPEETHENHLCQ